MPTSPVKIDTIQRLNRNLGLMQAGSIVTIDISTPAGQKAKFRTIFIGYLPKQYVLIQFPDSGKISKFGQFITQGAAVTVRGIIEGHEGAVAAFVSTIKQTLQIPSKIMVLDFPKTLSMQSLRSAIRIDTDIVSKTRVENKYWRGHITDLSLTGCQLFIENGEELKLVNDKSLEIYIEDFQELENLKLSGLICSEKNVSNGISLGVKFDDSQRESTIKLLHHIITLEA